MDENLQKDFIKSASQNFGTRKEQLSSSSPFIGSTLFIMYLYQESINDLLKSVLVSNFYWIKYYKLHTPNMLCFGMFIEPYKSKLNFC